MAIEHSRIKIVSPAGFDSGTAQTPGSLRLAAVAPQLGVESAMWGGLFEVQPRARTGIHHHGEQQTIAYVLSGICDETILPTDPVDPCLGALAGILASSGVSADPDEEVVWEISTGRFDNQGQPIYKTLETVGDTTNGLRQHGVVRLGLPHDLTDIGSFAVADAALGGTGDAAADPGRSGPAGRDAVLAARLAACRAGDVRTRALDRPQRRRGGAAAASADRVPGHGQRPGQPALPAGQRRRRRRLADHRGRGAAGEVEALDGGRHLRGQPRGRQALHRRSGVGPGDLRQRRAGPGAPDRPARPRHRVQLRRRPRRQRRRQGHHQAGGRRDERAQMLEPAALGRRRGGRERLGGAGAAARRDPAARSRRHHGRLQRACARHPGRRSRPRRVPAALLPGHRRDQRRRRGDRRGVAQRRRYPPRRADARSDRRCAGCANGSISAAWSPPSCTSSRRRT